MERFSIELAGVAIGIEAQYATTREVFSDYLTTRAPEVAFTVTGEAIRQEKENMERYSSFRANKYFPHTEEALEGQWLYHQIAACLPAHGVLLLHGSAVAVDGEAYLFAASSGVGKSTHARLWRQRFGERAVMVNDDRVLLKCGGDRILACGSPWTGKHRIGNNVSCPLRAIAFLQRDTVNSVTPVSFSDAFPELMRHCYYKREKESILTVMDLLGEVAGKAACYRLRCNRQPDAARISYEGMQADHKRGT